MKIGYICNNYNTGAYSSGISRQGILIDGVSVVFNGNDKGKTAEISYGSSGNSRRHTVNIRFNDANKGKVDRIDNDSSGNSRQRTVIIDANETYSDNCK